MFAKLTALVGSGSALPFDLSDPYPSAWGKWTHYKGTLRADGSNVSVFRISSQNKDDNKLEAARNGVKRLRTVSPPSFFSRVFYPRIETNTLAHLGVLADVFFPFGNSC